ncbi:MAG: 2OG-Fe(II) oxygenase [Actinomycetota bacterium]|nr:2OG-Fe(II) oxygenase [Actinomycetota bacterium]
MTSSYIDTGRHPITDPRYGYRCRGEFDEAGALVLDGFFAQEAVLQVSSNLAPHEQDAFYASSTHNVYLTATDPQLSLTHPFNRQVASSKGLIADNEIPHDSPLREVYTDRSFQDFLCAVLDVDKIYPYADDLSSINVHFAAAGQELGWHFDNSSFAVTMLLQAPESGGIFEYVADVRDADAGDMAFEGVVAVLDGITPAEQLEFQPGDLVLFRGRDALHRVTPTEGAVTRMLAVFAYNDQPGVGLSESALTTFYGRTGVRTLK